MPDGCSIFLQEAGVNILGLQLIYLIVRILPLIHPPPPLPRPPPRHRLPPTPPPCMDASACAREDGALRLNRPPNTERAVAAGRRLYWLPLAGLMFFCSMCRRVTVLVSLGGGGGGW